MNTKRTASIFLALLSLSLFLTLSMHSENFTNAPIDLVAFFKQAICAPPDIERFTVNQLTIKSGKTLYYAGARAGSNYFLKVLSDSNALLNLDSSQFTFGRSDTNQYQVGQNISCFGIGSNLLTKSVGIQYSLTRQFLNMGMTEIEPDTVKWEGNTFTSKSSNGRDRFGGLSISNGLPFRLGISAEKDSPPYKVVEYTYPTPPTSLNGFPSKMVIWGGGDSELKPVLEIEFYSVRLASRSLSDEYFTAAQFIGTNIIHTNIYSNADVYVENMRGQIIKQGDQARKSSGYTNSRSRSVILIFLILTTLAPVGFFILKLNKQKSKKNQ